MFNPQPKNGMPSKKVKQPIKRTSIKKKKSEPSGELALFHSIWNTREHKCAVTNEPLYEFNVWYFSHILSKAKNKYPKFKLYEKNIVIKSPQIHHDWETKAHSYLAKDPRWIPILKLKEELLEEYKLLDK